MGCWPSVRSRWLHIGQVLFCVFMDRHGMKWNGFRRKFSRGTRWVVPSGQDSSHSRPQRPRSFWSAPRITTSGLVQRRSNDIPVLNGFVNTKDWHQNQSDLLDLTLSMRRVTGSPWIADFRCWTSPEVAILGADQKERVLWGREWIALFCPLEYSQSQRAIWFFLPARGASQVIKVLSPMQDKVTQYRFQCKVR